MRVKLEITKLVNLMLDQLPESVWSSDSTTFLDPAFGGGQFIRQIEKRLLAAGHSPENIASRIWGCEIHNARLKYIKNWHKVITTNLILTDFVSYDWGLMKFDVIVGNPPYQSTESAGKKLWPVFVEKSYDLLAPHGHLAMVTPATWINRPQGRSYSNITQNIFSMNHLAWINLDVNNHFQIGETVVAWHMQKVPSCGLPTTVLNKGVLTHVIYDAQPIATSAQHQIMHDVMKKVDDWTGIRLKDVVYNDVQGKSIAHYIQNKILFDKPHSSRVPVFWTAANTGEYHTPKQYQRQGHKLIVNLSGYYYQEHDPHKYMIMDSKNQYAVGAGALGVPCDTIKHLKNCKSYLTSKLFQFYVNNEKTSGFNTGIIKLPWLDPAQSYTDDQIYHMFGLNADQIEFVNLNYGRKI